MPSTDSQIAPSFDSLVTRVQALEDGLHMHRHLGWDLTQPLINTPISSGVFTNASTLGDGTSTSGTLTLLRAAGQGSVYIKGGTIAAGDFANAGAKSGFIIGEDDADGKDKFYFGSSTAYIKYDGTTLTIVGSLSVTKLDIPDTTTANSFHTDTSGNSWWGSNVASGLANANASITSAGLATFKNILIGGATIQYTVTNSGMFTFGDGSDSAGVADGSTAVAGASLAANVYTLTRDVYFTNLTISTGVTINTAGYRIFGTGTFTINGTGKIMRNGNNGGNGVNHGGGGAGGAALADGYLKGSAAGGTGGIASNVTPTAPTDGSSTTNSIGSGANASGAGGAGTGAGGSAAGATGTATGSNVKLIANWHLATLLDVGTTGATVKFGNSASAGGGGYGGRGNVVTGGDGGGAGSPGGIVAIYFRNIVIGASASITANGGNGGNGDNGTDNGVGDAGGGGGGGSGGNGGQVILVYNTLSNSGSISASAGTGGTGGTGVHATPGTAGQAGVAGAVRQFQVSL